MWYAKRYTSINTIMTMENSIRILMDSLSVPKMMGKGPMRTAPPPLILPRTLRDESMRRIAAMNVITNPVKTSKSPTLDNN